MALQELSFVTLGQRVLNKPLRIRQHYGHPDLFDKFFVMTEGGMSKATKVGDVIHAFWHLETEAWH